MAGREDRAPKPRRPRPIAPAIPALQRLKVVQGSAAAGDALLALALAGSLFFSVPETTARGRVALYLGLTMAPFALVSPLLARVLDRHGGGLRFALLISGVGRGVLAWLLADKLTSLYLFPIAFGVLMLSRVGLIARGAFLPQVIEDERSYVGANAALSRNAAIMGIIGGLVGLAISKLIGSSFELRLAAIVYATGALWALGLPRKKGRRAESEKASARAVARSISIRQAIVAMAGLRFLTGFLVFHLAFALRREDFGSVGLGLLIGSAAAGGLAGAIVAPRLRATLREEGIIVFMLAVSGAAGLVAGYWFSLIMAGVLIFAFGVSSGAAKVAFDSLVQRETPEAARGWAFARFESTVQLGWVMGAAIPLLIPIPGGTGAMIGGVIATILAVIYTAGRTRSRKDQTRREGRA